MFSDCGGKTGVPGGSQTTTWVEHANSTHMVETRTLVTGMRDEERVLVTVLVSCSILLCISQSLIRNLNHYTNYHSV